MQSSQPTSSSTRRRCTRAVFGFASTQQRGRRRRRAGSGRPRRLRRRPHRYPSGPLVIRPHHGAGSASGSRRSSGARWRAGCRARRTRSGTIWSGRSTRCTRPSRVDAVLVRAGSAGSAPARGRSAATRSRAGTLCSSSTSGNTAPKRSAHIGLIATTTSPFSRCRGTCSRAGRRCSSRSGRAGRGRRRCGCRRAGTCPCRRARSRRRASAAKPRRSASDGHGDRSSHSPMQNPKPGGLAEHGLGRLPARWPPMLRMHSATARPMVIEPRPAAPPMQPAR